MSAAAARVTEPPAVITMTPSSAATSRAATMGDVPPLPTRVP